jgi:hypothetical protein
MSGYSQRYARPNDVSGESSTSIRRYVGMALEHDPHGGGSILLLDDDDDDNNNYDDSLGRECKR